ncbi:hypothetical protein ABZ915_41265 [Streptomyces sp. NPDC046915]|uniref:hypothetical protein n=1 Tax=Streptomyces sp. NPDC046915 TaxID=3155257 RepID=UPI0033EC922F
MSAPAGPLFAPYTDLDDYTRAVADAEAGYGPLPVWTGDRGDLLDGIALAEQVYGGHRTPDPADTGVLFGHDRLPEALRALVGPLARRWVTDPARLPEDGSVLLVGTYARLRGDEVRQAVEDAYAAERPLSLLTGPDVHSLSWLVAQQYARVVPGAAAGVVCEPDAAEPVPEAVRVAR